MLTTCNLCKKRKKRCDFSLPSCKHCESMGVQCEYFDEGMGNTVPREYIKSLNDSVTTLKGELEAYKRKIDKRKLMQRNHTQISPSKDLYEKVKHGIFIQHEDTELLFFEPGSMVSIFYMTSVMLQLEINTDQLTRLVDFALPPVHIPFDYNTISSEHIKLLIMNYLNEIYPKFPLVSESFFHQDIMIKNYPDSEEIFILLILLLSSTHLMRKRIDFVPIKIMLQQKTLDLLKSKLNNECYDTLICLLLYAIYELLDPEIGESVWKTIGLACDMAEKLRIHDKTDKTVKIVDNIPKSNILQVLAFLDSNISTIMGRPPCLQLSFHYLDFIEKSETKEILIDCLQRNQFFDVIHGNNEDCPVVNIFGHSNVTMFRDSTIWLMGSHLISHKCLNCELLFDSMILKLVGSCFKVIEQYEKNLRDYDLMFFWIALSKLTISILDLVVIRKLFPSSYSGIISDSKIFDYIIRGQQLVGQISATWYYSSSIKSIINMIVLK